jgi:hypothetical protein
MIPPNMSEEELERRDDPFVKDLKKGDPNFITPMQLDKNYQYVVLARRRLLQKIE